MARGTGVAGGSSFEHASSRALCWVVGLLVLVVWAVRGLNTPPRDDGEPVELFVAEMRSGRSVSTYDERPSVENVASDDEQDGWVLRPVGRAVPIGEAHNKGLLHRGTWTLVRDEPDGRVLLLRRSAHTMTCPSTWGLVGEHSWANESWPATASRAMLEELGVRGAEVSMLGPPVLFAAEYGAGSGLRADAAAAGAVKREFQSTALLQAVIPRGAKLVFDRDVAAHRWVTLRQLQHLLHVDRSGTHRVFCNRRLRVLLALVLKRLAPSRGQ